MALREIAVQYLTHFCAGELPALEALFADDLKFSGPFIKTTSRGEYIGELRKAPPVACTFEIDEVVERDRSVAIFYTFKKPGVATPMAQLFRFKNSLIAEVLLIFDSAAFTPMDR